VVLHGLGANRLKQVQSKQRTSGGLAARIQFQCIFAERKAHCTGRKRPVFREHRRVFWQELQEYGPDWLINRSNDLKIRFAAKSLFCKFLAKLLPIFSGVSISRVGHKNEQLPVRDLCCRHGFLRRPRFSGYAFQRQLQYQ
jgi:hypothetical protein